MIELVHLSFSYGSEPVLRDVSLAADTGEAVALVGANGAGKTTLLRIAAGVFLPDSGAVLSNGTNAAADPVRHRRSIGYAPETDAPAEEGTVKSYLKFRARLKGERAARLRRRVLDIAKACGIVSMLDIPMALLSRGNARRVALAEAMMMRPRHLLLDDPFAGLDPSAREAAVRAIAAARRHSAVIFSAHEFDAAASAATRVAVLKNGTIADDFRVTPDMDAAAIRARALAAHPKGGGK